MKHVLIMVLIISILSMGMFLPYLPGEYDYLANGLSSVIQFAVFASVFLVPVGLVWSFMMIIKSKRINKSSGSPVYLWNIVLAVTIIIILAGALGGLATRNRFMSIIILGLGVFIILKIYKKGKEFQASSFAYSIASIYLVLIPLALLFIRITFLEKIKDKATFFVIQQSELLIKDIEAYQDVNGHYPISLLSTIEDYKPCIFGIERFHYEPSGDAYNLYFEQISDMIGTQEIVMYNPLDEHEMTVHNQDLLRIAHGSIIRGYHAEADLPISHWKIFYFD